MVSLVLSIFGFVFSESVVRLLGPEPEVIPAAVGYLRIWFMGVPFIFGFFVFQALIRGSGNTVSPMRLMVASTILNIVLDPFLIFGWGPFPALGVPGAAVATVISRGIATVFGLAILFKGTLGLQAHLRDLWPRLDTVRTMLNIGAPAAIEQSARAFAMTAMTAVVASYGTPALAAFGIGNRVISVVFMPSMGFAESTTAMVGQNLGADLPERAERATWIGAGSMMGILTGLGALIFLAGNTWVAYSFPPKMCRRWPILRLTSVLPPSALVSSVS